MIKEAIILAGGLGTRLQPVLGNTPKPMALINGKPFLHYIFQYLRFYQIPRVILSVSPLTRSIEEHFGKNYLGIELLYSYENEPLGTGGGVKLALQKCNADTVLVLNGDTLFSVDLFQLSAFHVKNNAQITLALKYCDEIGRFGKVNIDHRFRITGFEEKKTGVSKNGYINGGVYLINIPLFTSINFPSTFSIEKDFFEKYLEHINFLGFVSNKYFIDIGIPEDYLRAQNEFKTYQF
ncbi:MAG: nucleotidyltransferase family protein [Bacteroidetes bacterium]|nr:nucleotidyltransferase family protein [Bacteroidota bacterium]MBK9673035.1 nucleotidyltransferase family protein [Bacteroidota bacterium]MBK9801100.1 nucleotidyltransferase family protein [Bacteroidota bacterium]MBP6413196.1 nucleotidyltransferase family protein [Bacteroidia bacterium]